MNAALAHKPVTSLRSQNTAELLAEEHDHPQQRVAECIARLYGDVDALDLGAQTRALDNTVIGSIVDRQGPLDDLLYYVALSRHCLEHEVRAEQPSLLGATGFDSRVGIGIGDYVSTLRADSERAVVQARMRGTPSKERIEQFERNAAAYDLLASHIELSKADAQAQILARVLVLFTLAASRLFREVAFGDDDRDIGRQRSRKRPRSDGESTPSPPKQTADDSLRPSLLSRCVRLPKHGPVPRQKRLSLIAGIRMLRKHWFSTLMLAEDVLDNMYTYLHLGIMPIAGDEKAAREEADAVAAATAAEKATAEAEL